jgi:hypothetical protein
LTYPTKNQKLPVAGKNLHLIVRAANMAITKYKQGKPVRCCIEIISTAVKLLAMARPVIAKNLLHYSNSC